MTQIVHQIQVHYVSERVYKKFKAHEKNKKGLDLNGISSFSGYLTSITDSAISKGKSNY
jgi:hypothetical protein